ncbi:hypothetical protein [Rhizobium sp. Leaf383]|uniref:hypothetical protein n=1 Tax=Rhizobium sp. Leaf383 TaxID=1736357 RepID=UPI00071239A9|nr:hypothetical protein [Rhizobium sp. Leaf383]KQS76427.1 hypothetical protein ASG58_11430 [Rhizobium sp. Leaf383]
MTRLLTRKMDIESWLDAIASKAKVERSEVEEVFSRFSIRPTMKPAIPHRLNIRSLSFTGRKRGHLNTPISFQWTGLRPGIHAIVSSENLMGKTSVLKLMQLGLNGSTEPQGDVSLWLDTLSLEFSIDDDRFETRIDDFAKKSGALLFLKPDRQVVISEFEGAHSFKSAMEAFFLDRLGLHVTRIVVDKGGKDVLQDHGWPWLSTSMTIEPDPGAIFGNMPRGGMQYYMMRMFVGLPWIGTHTDILAAKKTLEMESERRHQAATRSRSVARMRLAELEQKRKQLGERLSGKDPVEVLIEQDRVSMAALASLSEELGILIRKKAAIADALSAAEDAVSTAIRERLAFDEARDAGRIFRLLAPRQCPSCDEVFTDELRDARVAHHDCVVCGRDEKPSDDPEGIREDIVEREAAAKASSTRLRGKSKILSRHVEEKQNELRQTEASLAETRERLRSAETAATDWKEALKLDAQIEEVRRLLDDEANEVDRDLVVLKAAEAATSAQFAEDQKVILKEVSELIVEFARSFGMRALEKVEMAGTAMKVFKGGSVQNFGSCTSGERARLKLSATLAMVQVAERRGIGRHPGLLFIDSPGAGETADENLSQMVEGLAKLPAVLPAVQVFITSISNPALLDHVPCDNVKHPGDDGFVW